VVLLGLGFKGLNLFFRLNLGFFKSNLIGFGFTWVSVIRMSTAKILTTSNKHPKMCTFIDLKSLKYITVVVIRYLIISGTRNKADQVWGGF